MVLSISVWTVPVLSSACAFPEKNHQERLFFVCVREREKKKTSEGKENNGRGMQRCPRIVALKNILSQC